MRQAHGKRESVTAPSPEAQFNLGYLYRTIENHIDAFAAEAGSALALADVTDRMGQLLRLKAAKIRSQLGAAQLLLEMRENGAAAGRGAGYRSGGAARPALLGSTFDGGALKPKSRRDLSIEARAAIAAAQRKRWKLQKRAARAATGKRSVGRPRLDLSVTARASAARSAAGVRNYWAKMTPAERSKEMLRRQTVARSKKARVNGSAEARA